MGCWRPSRQTSAPGKNEREREVNLAYRCSPHRPVVHAQLAGGAVADARDRPSTRACHTSAFAATWRSLVVALHDLGERYVELRGDEVTAFIEEGTALVG